jgi:DNA-binding response OmpR family regulator
MALSVLGDNRFDLIFLDVNLPQGSGFDLCTQVRQLEDHRRTPVVFLTGMNNFKSRAQGSLSGGNDFIGKPFNLLELGVKALMWIFKGQLAAA